jgi:DNA primase
MAGRIPQSFIDELVTRTDIVELIGTRVPLKKAGREYRACCPFHDEKTPSFWVSPDKQFYHCFGCGAHGTALGFLMNYDQLPFPEAVEELAGRLGLEVPHDGGAAPAPTQHEGLHDMLARVAGFYEETLRGSERARSYLRGRGLDAAIIERFRIGFAPDAWNEALRRFGATDESRQRLLASGLIVERETPRPGSEPWYDRFRDRIMFPIRDPRGRVLGFGGRVLDKGEPKYLNSPETEIFHKGRELYGLHEARLARVKLERLLIVEGYMDVVRLHQAGVQYAVATLGTATTAEHLRRAFKLVNEIVFCFDGDRAGRGAAWRALQHVLPEAREGREVPARRRRPRLTGGPRGPRGFRETSRHCAAVVRIPDRTSALTGGHGACRRPRTTGGAGAAIDRAAARRCVSRTADRTPVAGGGPVGRAPARTARQ